MVLPAHAAEGALIRRIASLFRSAETRSGRLDDGLTALLLGGGGPTLSNVTVTTESAMRCIPVYGAIKVLAETLAQIPCHLYRRLPDGGRERATDHPLEPLLSVAANDWTPAAEFRMAMQVQLSLHGNAFAFINRAGERVTEIIPLSASRVQIDENSRTMAPVYRVVSGSGDTRDYTRREILHIKGIGASLCRGDSPVALGREAIGLAMVLERHGAALFGNGAKPAGLLKYTKMLTNDVRERLRSSFDSRFSGSGNSGKTLILEDGMEWTQLALNSVDAQFLEQRKFQLQEIARIWRVPLHLLADLERVTHSNAEQMGQQFLSYCVLPILRLWTDAMAITLLSPAERGEYYFEFTIDDIARADLAARMEAYSKAINAGVISPNEARAMENRAPYAGGETFMRPVNTAPAPSGNQSAGGADAAAP